MRALVIHAHPLPDSYCAALRDAACDGLRAAGAEVDVLDLYAEGFDPVLSAPERRAYHDAPANRAGVARHVERLVRADALALVAPVWNFGHPAILKGFFDRVFLPGLTFRMLRGAVAPGDLRFERVWAVHSYGATRLAAALAGDPPRRFARRVMRRLFRPARGVRYLAIYDMNRADHARRATFLRRVRADFARG